MFTIENSPTQGVQGDTKWVIDHSRGAWMQRVGDYAMSPVVAFQLHSGDRVFLFERARWPKPDGTYGSRIDSLGYSAIAALLFNIKSDSFTSDEDRHAVGLLAAEAVLVYGSFYNGSDNPETNTQTIEFDGETYTLRDLVALNSKGGHHG